MEHTNLRTVGLLALALVAGIALAGCMDSGDEDFDTSGGGSDACVANSHIQPGADASMGQVICRERTGQHAAEAKFTCAQPQHASVNWDADMEQGEATITIEDANGEVVFERPVTQGGRNSARPSEGATGEWTIRAELSSDFTGSFATTATCPKERNSGETAPKAGTLADAEEGPRRAESRPPIPLALGEPA